MRAVEGIVFVSLAVGLHVGVWAIAPGGAGLPPSGQEGTAALSLAAATPREADLVDRWTRPPVATDSVRAPTPPQTGPALPATPAPQLAPGRVERPSDALTAPKPDQAAFTAPEPLPRPVAPKADVPAAPRPPETSTPPEVETPPETARQVAPPPKPMPPDIARAPDPETTPAEPRQAAQPQARAAGPVTPQPVARSETAGSAAAPRAASSARAQALQANWGARIQRKVHRNLRHPGASAGEGTARVALVVDRSGRLAGLRLVGSSGVAALDQAALAAVQRAGRFPAAPQGLDEGSYTFTLSLSFRR